MKQIASTENAIVLAMGKLSLKKDVPSYRRPGTARYPRRGRRSEMVALQFRSHHPLEKVTRQARSWCTPAGRRAFLSVQASVRSGRCRRVELASANGFADPLAPKRGGSTGSRRATIQHWDRARS